jgi:hypothetical protein
MRPQLVASRAVAVAALTMALPECASAFQHERVKLLLNDPLSFEAPANRCTAEVCTSLVALIESAMESIDFAIYGARSQDAILGALLDAEARGIRVRGLVDRDNSGSNYYHSTDEWARRLPSDGSDQSRESTPEDDGDYAPKCSRPQGFNGPLQCLAYDLGRSWLTAEHASREDFTDP